MAVKRSPTMLPAKLAFKLAAKVRFWPRLHVALQAAGRAWVERESKLQKRNLER